MLYTLKNQTSVLETRYADVAVMFADGREIYADGIKVDYDGLLNFVGSCRYDYDFTITEEDAARNIASWIEDGIELPAGINAELLAAVWNNKF